jgi:hypothetical protein
VHFCFQPHYNFYLDITLVYYLFPVLAEYQP